MFSRKTWLTALIAATALQALAAEAGVNVSEDFTGTATTNSWYYFNGACLTASTASAAASAPGPGSPPGCTADSYYTEHLVGGYNGVSGSAQTLPDPDGEGALRFTNGCIYQNGSCSTGGHSQNGAIVSADTFSTNQGLDITFKTVTYRGDSGGANKDGADGMSFFLVDGDTWSPTDNPVGSWGGSLGYTCSNVNTDYHGMVGAYLGLGIDEYGNFLNGTKNTLGESGTSATGDNTASGGGYKPNRIGIRGAGNIAWSWLNDSYPGDYPSTLTSSQQQEAVRYTCKSGYVWNFSNPSSPSETQTTVMDYPAIPNAYEVISSKIAKEYSSGGYSRVEATPITYHVKITQNGLLSLWYSYDGGSWIGVIENEDITSSNEALPDSLRFGFAGSTGGSSNIHELLCFKATPITQASSSATLNQQQSSKVEVGSQVYFSYYDPSDWTGRMTANSLYADSAGNLTIASTANWDASCVLTGVASGSTCPTTAQNGPIAAEAPTSRVMLTWSGSAGIPLEWSNLTTAEQTALDAGDATQTDYRLEYLRGDRSEELTSSGSGLYRDRDSVLGDIVDSSPAWVGPPSKSIYSAYESPQSWQDKLYPTTTMPENSGQSYAKYLSSVSTRLNVVYVGANDGLLHGFAAGSYDSTGTSFDTSTNTGNEVLAYMPQGVLEDIHSATNANIDYSNAQYGHNFYVDATPGTGDLYYGGAWHTWLVSGLGPGGAEIFALDVTTPTNFSESNASSLVIGDWTSASLSCVNVASCGNDLGDTYGTPVIRRLHNGDWAVIYGNGIGSANGDAGIYIMLVDPSSGAISGTYYLSTGQSGTNDGITYVAPVDMDGDHVVDYVYAGDLNGNLWRFDLTSSSPSSWAVTPGPIFTTPSGQPITSAVQPGFVTNTATNQTQLMLYFGTGEKFPITNTSATSYQSGTQAFYGVWDWNMDAWNAHNQTQFETLSATAAGTASGAGASGTLSVNNLQQQIITVDSSGNRNVTSTTTLCWAGTTACTSGDNQFGWYVDLPGSNSGYSQTTYEQVIYNPQFISTAIVFNSILPGIDSPLACTAGSDSGWTYALDARTGGPVVAANNTPFFVNNGNTQTVGLETDASGSVSEVTTAVSGGGTKEYLIFQSLNGGAGTPIQIQPSNNVSGSRETWIELR